MVHSDDPNTLGEFLEWIREWRVKIVEPPSGFPAFDMRKLVAYRRERFLIHLNKFLGPDPLSEFYSEFDVDQCVSASDVVRMMLWAETRIHAEFSGDKDDTTKKFQQSQPSTADVRDLCHLLDKQREARKQGKPEITIAREFTGETPANDRRARSLLRQARRYPHLWKDDKDDNV